jgi:5-methylcytosine-specific restriction protein A
MDGADIKRNLEIEYDIPFEVTRTVDNGEPVYVIEPEDDSKELFAIRISFRNKVRLCMDFVPHKYSANFIEAMSHQPEENKKRFIRYATLLTERGAKCNISANGTPLDLEDTSKWPDSWNDFKLRITKMPIESDSDFQYSEVANTWGSLMMGMVLSLANIVPIEDESSTEGYSEGDVQRVEVNRYERNPLNRKLCLAEKGYNCAVCGFNFEEKYGIIGKDFIHVHHIVPVSEVGPSYIIDPVNDLEPVCPNCHAMLHRKTPPYLPDELRRILQDRSMEEA